MIKRLASATLLIGAVLVISACAHPVGRDWKPAPAVVDTDLIESSYAAADKLMENLITELDASKTLLVATFVDIDNVDRSNTLGRMVSEQIGSRITQHGFGVIEIKLREQLSVRQETGELLLSRDYRALRDGNDAQAVVVGSYALGQDKLYVNARIVRLGDNVVISAHNYSLPIGSNTRTMIRPKL